MGRTSIHHRAAERFVWLLAIAIAALGLVAAQSVGMSTTLASSHGGANPCEQGQAGANNPNCDDDGKFDPPEDGTVDPPEDEDEDNGEGGNPIQEICQQVVDALADGGAPEDLTDGLQQLCDALDAGEVPPGEFPPGEVPPGGDDSDDSDEDEDNGEGGNPIQEICQQVVDGLEDGGAPAELTDGLQQLCDALDAGEFPPGDGGEAPEDCSGLVEALEDGGAPAELTDGLQQLCDAAEGDGGDGGEGGDEGGEGGNALQDGCGELFDALADGGAPEELDEARALCDAAGELPLDELPLPLGL